MSLELLFAVELCMDYQVHSPTRFVLCLVGLLRMLVGFFVYFNLTENFNIALLDFDFRFSFTP